MSKIKDTEKSRSKQTLDALAKSDTTPLGIRLWMERYIERGESELDNTFVGRDETTEAQARLIYDVLMSEYLTVDDDEFSPEARDFIEEYLYTLSDASDIYVWNQPDLATHALPVLIECANGSVCTSADFAMLEIAIRRLSTARERRRFLRSQESGDETKENRDYRAAFKLSRLIADPRTPAKTRTQLGSALVELFNETDMHIDHPALVRRAAEVMFENVTTDAATRIYDHIHSLLESLPEAGEGDGQQ
jgi:hypothetical protein